MVIQLFKYTVHTLFVIQLHADGVVLLAGAVFHYANDRAIGNTHKLARRGAQRCCPQTKLFDYACSFRRFDPYKASDAVLTFKQGNYPLTGETDGGLTLSSSFLI